MKTESIQNRIIKKVDGIYYVKLPNGKLTKYHLVKCSYCNNDCYVWHWNGSYKKTGLGFCSHECKVYYYHNKKDPVLAQIMNKQNEDSFYYLLGMLATDGTIRYPERKTKYTTYSALIELNIKDREILDKLQNMFGGALHVTHKNKAIKLSLHNKEFVLFLKNVVGLTTRKSLTLNIKLKWFSLLTPTQKLYFMRGCYDGDGTVLCNSSNRKQGKYISICTNSKKFGNLIKTYYLNLGFKPHENSYFATKNKTYRIVFYCKNALIACNDIFTTSSIGLQRKTDKFKELQQYYSN